MKARKALAEDVAKQSAKTMSFIGRSGPNELDAHLWLLHMWMAETRSQANHVKLDPKSGSNALKLGATSRERPVFLTSYQVEDPMKSVKRNVPRQDSERTLLKRFSCASFSVPGDGESPALCSRQ